MDQLGSKNGSLVPAATLGDPPRVTGNGEAFKRYLAAALILLNLLVAAVAALSVHHDRKQSIRDAETTAANLATVVEQNIAGLISHIDFSLLAARDEFRRQEAGDGVTVDLDGFLLRQTERISVALTLRMADANGRMNYVKGTDRSINIADRDHFIHARDATDDTLIIGRPVLSRSGGNWILPLARRIERRDGSFAGIVYAAVALDNLSAAFAHLDTGRYGGIALRDGELGLILRVPELDGIGAKIGDKTISQAAKDLVAAARHPAVYTAVAPADGRERTAALRKVGAWPLYVIASRATDDYLAGWYERTSRTVALVLGGFGFSFGFGRLLSVAWRQRLAAAAALAESRELFKTVTEHANDWVYWRSADMRRFHYISPLCERITGYSVAEFEADPALLDCILHPDDRAAWDAHVLCNDEDPSTQDYRIITRHGDTRWIRHSCRAVHSPDGKPQGRRGANTDISAEKRAEMDKEAALAQLAESGLRLKTIVENEPECVKVLALDGTLQQMNHAGLTMIEADSPDQVIGRPITDMVAPAHVVAFNTLAERVRQGQSGSLEFESNGLKGGHRWLEMHAVPLRDTAENIVGLLAVTRDMTAHRAAELALRESERRLSAMLDASSESTMLLTPRGDILAINATGASRFGLAAADMKGRSFFDFLPRDLAASRRDALAQVIASGQPTILTDRRGQIRFENNVYPVRNEAGEVESVAVYAKDVTEARRAEGIDAMFHRLNLMLLKWSMNVDSIAQQFCDEIRPLFDLAAACIRRLDEDGTLVLVAAAEDFSSMGLLERIRVSGGERVSDGACALSAAALDTGNLQKADFDSEQCAGCRDHFQAAGVASVMVLPLTLRGRQWGVVTFYAHQNGMFNQSDVPPRLAAITSRISTSLEAALQQEWLTLLETALEVTGNAVFITDAAGRILWSNRAFTGLSGYSREELLGKSPKIFGSGCQDAEFYARFWQTIRAGEVWRGEVINARPDGSHYTVNQTVTPLRDNFGVNHYVSMLEDITERKTSEARVAHMASFDLLTDLPNRRLFFDRLGQELTLARRDGHGGAIMFLDLDRFKAVNDTLGHAAGDLLLKVATRRIGEQVRESDTVARLGGDEFAVLLPHAGLAEDAGRVARKIVAAIDAPFEMAQQEVNIGVSIGIALYPGHGDDPKALLHAADKAMYQAKQAGRNTWRFADAQDACQL